MLSDLKRKPRRLRQAIYDQIDFIFSLPCAQPGVTEDVFQTLSQPTFTPQDENFSVTLLFEPTTLPR
jgi:hypothetical protein